MDGKDQLSFQSYALARPFHLMGMSGMLPLLHNDMFKKCKMEHSVNGRFAGGCVRKTIRLKVKHVDLHANQHSHQHHHLSYLKYVSVYLQVKDSKTLFMNCSSASCLLTVTVACDSWNR